MHHSQTPILIIFGWRWSGPISSYRMICSKLLILAVNDDPSVACGGSGITSCEPEHNDYFGKRGVCQERMSQKGRGAIHCSSSGL
jgi:hypothetical protein